MFFGTYCMCTCITGCPHQHHAHRGFTDSPAGIVKRSPSSIVLDTGITVSFIHQTSDYIKMSFPGVKNIHIHYQFTLSYSPCHTCTLKTNRSFTYSACVAPGTCTCTCGISIHIDARESHTMSRVFSRHTL